MKQSFLDFIFLILLSATIPLYAANHAFAPGINMDFIIAPHQREEFTNFSFSTVNGTCIINTVDADGNDILVEVLRKKGKVNDQPLSKGDTVIIRVHDKETLRISAEAGGRVALTNLGTYSVKAKCTSTA